MSSEKKNQKPILIVGDERFEVCRIGEPKVGEQFLSSAGDVDTKVKDVFTYDCPMIRPILRKLEYPAATCSVTHRFKCSCGRTFTIDNSANAPANPNTSPYSGEEVEALVSAAAEIVDLYETTGRKNHGAYPDGPFLKLEDAVAPFQEQEPERWVVEQGCEDCWVVTDTQPPDDGVVRRSLYVHEGQAGENRAKNFANLLNSLSNQGRGE